ncbi:UNC-like C-terminal-domain-containing protein, partial [Dimargaris cristalligena]
KGRFNHASVDCAAVVIKANPEAKGSSAILTNSKEKYMLNPCSASRFVIIELCDDILIDAIAIANFEFFSSTFKEFTVQVTDRYPPKHNQWKPLGRFQAKNSRETQIFLVRDPIMWTRFIRIDFVTHYGSEYYCPVSMVRVYGNTIMEQYKKEEEDLVAGIDEPLDSLLPASRPDPQPKPWIDPPPPPPPATTAAAPKTASHLDPSQTLKSYWDRLDSIMNDDGPTSDGESTTTSTPTYRPPPSSGGTQESIFKTIMKRLGWLDRNLTLTYQYLEQQSHAINDVLTKIDYSHHQQLQQAFSYLNSTTTKQIQALKITCEEIWKAIIFDVEDYEHKSRKEIEDIHTRLHYLTQELIFEKRMRIAQLILLLVVILVI